MTTEVRVPNLGESITEATVVNWQRQTGDAVTTDEMLCELETDKVTIEVTASTDGVLGEIIVSEGSTVEVGALLTTISADAVTTERKDSSSANHSTKNAEPSSDRIEIRVPTLGESVTEATIASWSKAVGDTVSQDEILCELETDKVSVEVPSPTAGQLVEILASEGETVAVSTKLAVIALTDPTPASLSTPAMSDHGTTVSSRDTGRTAVEIGVKDAPAAVRAMANAGLSPQHVTGSGKDGRIMKDDVSKAIEALTHSTSPDAEANATAQPVAAEDADREERVKMSRLRQTIARRLKEAQNIAAILTTYNEVDMGAVMELRNAYKEQFEKKHQVRLGFMSFFSKACCHALKEVPEVNAEIDRTDIVYKNYVHMGIATGTPQGLVVPVIRNADSLSFAEIEKAIAEKGRKAREGKLSLSEMQGGTFTISNGGVYGSLMSSPILNPPQSGVLGMHKIQERPMVINGEIAIRPMMYLALSYDHRIVDGQGAVTFLVRVKEALEDPRRLLLDL